MNNQKTLTNKETKLNTNEYQNSVNSLSFSVRDSNSNELFTLDVSFEFAKKRWAAWGREYLIQWAGGYTNPDTQDLTARKNTIEAKRNHIEKIVTWASKNKPETSIGLWEEADLYKLIQDIAFNRIKLPKRNHATEALKVLSKDTLLRTVWHITNSGNLYRKGLLSDGYLEPTDFQNLLPNLKDEMIKQNISFEDWNISSSHDSVPLEIASLMLLEAINTIRSDEAKALRAYFNIQRTHLKQDPNTIVFMKGENTLIRQLVRGEAIVKQHKNKAEAIAEFLKAYRAEYLRLGGSISDDPVSWLLSISGHTELNEKVKEVYDACKVIFFCLTGIRVHEMRQTLSQDYSRDIDGVWRFKTREDKTQGGVKQLRAIAGVAAEAADIMCDISYINKRNRDDQQQTYLFGLYTASKSCFSKDKEKINHNGAAISRENFADRLKIFFQKIINKHGEQLIEPETRIIPHGFRHSFVDFVLRRFDGNIQGAIRNHFRHCIKGEFTSTYTDSKAQEQIERAAQEKYMEELVYRMVGENSQNFTGPIAMFIQKEVSKFKFVTENDLSPLIDSLISELHHLIPHEYGYCMVLKSRQHLAKCLDKKTGIAKVLNGCFELCSGCPNSFHHSPSHQSAIIRNVISHESFLEKFPIKNTLQAKVSKHVVEAGYNILSKMEHR